MRFLWCCLFLIATVGLADAQTAAQRKALSHFVMAQVIQEQCSDWRIKISTMAIGLSAFGIKISDLGADGRFSEAIREMRQSSAALFADKSEEFACEVAEAAYGPSGVIVKGLMTHR